MLSYSMGVSLDGYVAGPNGEIDWSAPDPELHSVPQRSDARAGRAPVRPPAVRGDALLGDAEQGDEVEREFARLWQALPKIVFSSTLTSVEGNARLAARGLAEELADLEGHVSVGGPGLAAEAARLGLINEYRLFVSPVVLGGGTPFFAPDVRLDLELVETRTFGGAGPLPPLPVTFVQDRGGRRA